MVAVGFGDENTDYVKPYQPENATEAITMHATDVGLLFSPLAGKGGPATVIMADAEKTTVVTGKISAAGAGQASRGLIAPEEGPIPHLILGRGPQNELLRLAERDGGQIFSTTNPLNVVPGSLSAIKRAGKITMYMESVQETPLQGIGANGTVVLPQGVVSTIENQVIKSSQQFFGKTQFIFGPRFKF
jgi:hypothetical protein